MKGLELSRQYYLTLGKDMLETHFPDYVSRIAVGLVGEGSECLGYDDEISRDHDFGPAFCMWLTAEDHRAIGKALQEAYEGLPGEFLGFPARHAGARSGGRTGALEIRRFYSAFIGDEQPPATLLRWLYLPEDKLAAAVSGEVFADPLGEFSAIRSALSAYYPEDVRIKKIAARAAFMAQAGQYNYGRCMRRGDSVAAGLAAAEFVRSAISMVYLLNRRYMPYYKWMFRGLQDLPILRETVPLLLELSEAGGQKQAWERPYPPDWNPYVNRTDRKVCLIEEICDRVLAELRRQNLTDGQEDFLEPHTNRIMARIQSPELRCRHVMEG